VNVVNLSSFQSDVRTTGPGGDINMRLPANEEFEVLLEKPGHFSMSLPVSTVGMKQGLIDLNAVRPLEMEEVVVGRAVQLKHVRWADGGSRLDPIARTELDGLAERIQVNPGLRFEVGVHEDGRMPVEKADALTRQRAEALQQYLVSKGVPAERVLVKAYGNGSPLNHCAPGVQCTAEEHAENRRVEYTVTSDGTR